MVDGHRHGEGQTDGVTLHNSIYFFLLLIRDEAAVRQVFGDVDILFLKCNSEFLKTVVIL